MKKVFCLFGSILICCLAIGTASASVTGSGTFELFGLPDSAVVADYRYGTSYTDPDTGENVSIQTYFGGINEYDSNGYYLGGRPYGLNPTDDSTDDYQGVGQYHTSSITGQFHSNGSEEFTLSAVSPDPDNVTASANINFIGSASFSGSIYDYDFGYNYAFSGNKDDDDDFLNFIIQAEVSYWDYVEDTYILIDIYSDYGDGGLITDKTSNYRTNCVNEDYDGENIEGAIVFDYSAADFVEGFDPDRRWLIRWDFMSNARDTVGSTTPGPAPVPEPATFILLGSGLAGLAFYRRKKK